jgi:hypothetical protein
VQFALGHLASPLDPAVVAALIAAAASLAALIAQFYGIRRVSRDTEKVVRKQLDQERLRTLNERFATAADRLGADRPAAVRLAAVHALAGLADDWPENRQTCVDVLCAYLGLPYEPEPSQGASLEKRLEFRASQRVRHTVIRMIATHLREGAGSSFSGGLVLFRGAEFSGGEVSFDYAQLSGGDIRFIGAKFSGGLVHLDYAAITGGLMRFNGAEFLAGLVRFGGVEFSGGMVRFAGAKFSGGQVSFDQAKFAGGDVTFANSSFLGGTVDLKNAAEWTRPPILEATDPLPPGLLLPQGWTPPSQAGD